MGKHKRTLKDEETSNVIRLYNKMLDTKKLIDSLDEDESILNSFIVKKVAVLKRSMNRVLSYYNKRWDTILPTDFITDEEGGDDE